MMRFIKLSNISKKFFLMHHPDRRMGRPFSYFSDRKMNSEFWALRGINLDIEEAKTIGVLGRNGSGKTTLLNIIAGISSPTEGDVKVNGKISALLTLGAGFNDELTGKENIYLNASILGMSRDEISQKYQSIVEFCELDGFLDSPLKTYSQGMYLRLGFSIAVHVDFDILLIDEILSVGDVSFQKKCFDKIERFRREGKTIVITSQGPDVLERLCDEVLLLEGGEIVGRGSPQEIKNLYLTLLNQKKLSDTFNQRRGKLKWWADRGFWDKKEGSREVKITDVRIYDPRGRQTDRLKPMAEASIKVDFAAEREIASPHFGVAIFREDGVYCYGPNTSLDGQAIDRLKTGKGFFTIKYDSLLLAPGRYRISTAIWDKAELWAYDYHVGFYKFEISGRNSNGQLLSLPYNCKDDTFRDRLDNLRGAASPGALFNPNYKYEDRDSREVTLSSVEISDAPGNADGLFHTGEDFHINLRFDFLKKTDDLLLWMGLFRDDNVYCHGVFRRLNREVLRFVYPRFPLLSGKYYLSIGLLKNRIAEPVFYKHRASTFQMSFAGDDHGTVYLEHGWKYKLP